MKFNHSYVGLAIINNRKVESLSFKKVSNSYNINLIVSEAKQLKGVDWVVIELNVLSFRDYDEDYFDKTPVFNPLKSSTGDNYQFDMEVGVAIEQLIKDKSDKELNNFIKENKLKPKDISDGFTSMYDYDSDFDEEFGEEMVITFEDAEEMYHDGFKEWKDFPDLYIIEGWSKGCYYWGKYKSLE